MEIHNGITSVGKGSHALSREFITLQIYSFDAKEAFLHFYAKSCLLYKIEDCLHVICMFFLVFRVDDYILDVDFATNFKDILKYFL